MSNKDKILNFDFKNWSDRPLTKELQEELCKKLNLRNHNNRLIKFRTLKNMLSDRFIFTNKRMIINEYKTRVVYITTKERNDEYMNKVKNIIDLKPDTLRKLTEDDINGRIESANAKVEIIPNNNYGEFIKINTNEEYILIEKFVQDLEKVESIISQLEDALSKLGVMNALGEPHPLLASLDKFLGRKSKLISDINKYYSDVQSKKLGKIKENIVNENSTEHKIANMFQSMLSK